jgi:phage terminase large subunit
VSVGAYFAPCLSKAREEGRIVAKLNVDPLMQIKTAWDIGFSDNTAIWVYQTIGQRILVLNFIEGSGQSLGYYTNELRARGYDNCHCILPHDGLNANAVTGLRYADHLRDAGFSVEVVPQRGKGAASQRIEAARRLFPKMWFDEEKTEAGRDALGSYQEKRDENRETGLGPLHNWASHAADAFGLACIAHRDPKELAAFYRSISYPRMSVA